MSKQFQHRNRFVLYLHNLLAQERMDFHFSIISIIVHFIVEMKQQSYSFYKKGILKNGGSTPPTNYDVEEK